MEEVVLSLSISPDVYGAGSDDKIGPLHDWLFEGDSPSRHGHGLIALASHQGGAR